MIYSAFTKIIVSFYVILIPLFIGDIDLGGEDSGFEFLAVPIMVIISTAFLTINKLANLYGEPFSENKTSVTIDDICKTIEQNCNEIKAKLEWVYKPSTVVYFGLRKFNQTPHHWLWKTPS